MREAIASSTAAASSAAASSAAALSALNLGASVPALVVNAADPELGVIHATRAWRQMLGCPRRTLGRTLHAGIAREIEARLRVMLRRGGQAGKQFAIGDIECTTKAGKPVAGTLVVGLTMPAGPHACKYPPRVAILTLQVQCMAAIPEEDDVDSDIETDCRSRCSSSLSRSDVSSASLCTMGSSFRTSSFDELEVGLDEVYDEVPRGLHESCGLPRSAEPLATL